MCFSRFLFLNACCPTFINLLSPIQTSAHHCVYFHQQNCALPGMADFLAVFAPFPPVNNFSWLSTLLSSSAQRIVLSWHGAKGWPVTGSWELCKEPPELKEAEKAAARVQVPLCTSLPFTKSVHWLSGPCGGAGFRKIEEERSPCRSPWSGNISRQNCKWMLCYQPPKRETNKTKKTRKMRKVFVEFRNRPYNSLYQNLWLY